MKTIHFAGIVALTGFAGIPAELAATEPMFDGLGSYTRKVKTGIGRSGRAYLLRV